MSILEAALAALAIFIGAFVQTSIGFGLAIVSAPFLFYLNPAYVPVPITIATLTNVMFVSHTRKPLGCLVTVNCIDKSARYSDCCNNRSGDDC